MALKYLLITSNQSITRILIAKNATKSKYFVNKIVYPLILTMQCRK